MTFPAGGIRSRQRPRVVMTCGPAGSGKTTFARQLEVQGFARLSIDEEVWKRIQSGTIKPGGNTRLVALSIEEDLRARLLDLVRKGRDVVIDFAFHQKASRLAWRKHAEDAGAIVELVYFRVPRKELHRRIADRNQTTGADAVPLDRSTLDTYISGFEIPGDDESPIVIDALEHGEPPDVE